MDFDTEWDHRGLSSLKWEFIIKDGEPQPWNGTNETLGDSRTLPMWVADMDFATPDFIRLAIQQRLDHPVLGYTRQPTELNQAFLSWLKRSQNWEA